MVAVVPPRRRTRAARLLELEITGLGQDGRGLAMHEGRPVRVHGALAGETVQARVLSRRRGQYEARVVEVLRAAPGRITPRCPHFGDCGGCALQQLPQAAQLEHKQGWLADLLSAQGLAPARWLAPLTAGAWGYRRKGRLSVRWVAAKDRVLVGFRQLDARWVADLADCAVIVPELAARLPGLAALIGSLTARDRIPQIEFAAGDGPLALTIRHLDPLDEADRAALLAFGREHGFDLYLQPGGPDSIEPLGEVRPLRYALPGHDVAWEFEPLDFIQVNGPLNAKMVDHALALLDPQPHERVLDLFCGLGNFSLPLARRVAGVTGIEGDPGLVARARANALANGIGNVDYQAADLFQDHAAAGWATAPWDAVLLDPPRSGAAAVLGYLPGPATRRVVYVSCDPTTLARDAGVLVGRHGFRLAAAGIMDMFPQTAHVESIALFER